MARYLFLIAVGTTLAMAQQKPDLQLPPDLVEYLQLTADQQTQIAQANSAITQLTSDKAARSAQVQSEIAQETQKATLDPMALGVRYVELEAIRRDIASQQNKTRAQVANLLTPAQRAKLQALQDALRLSAIGCEAFALNILDQPQNAAGTGAACTGWSNSTVFLPPMDTSQPPKP